MASIYMASVNARFNKWAMSNVHKTLTGQRLLTQSPRNECGRSSIDVYKLALLASVQDKEGPTKLRAIQSLFRKYLGIAN